MLISNVDLPSSEFVFEWIYKFVFTREAVASLSLAKFDMACLMGAIRVISNIVQIEDGHA